jgi:hypothetical protein
MIGCLLLSVLAFYFPIMPIYALLDMEFSNLGPIATAAWGLMIDMYLITPIFVYAILLKFLSKSNA